MRREDNKDHPGHPGPAEYLPRRSCCMADVIRAVDMQGSADEAPLHSLVVVGSSAGGIEALSTLVATLAADFPAPVVLAQHLDPRHPSHLGEILARRSTLPVRTV